MMFRWMYARMPEWCDSLRQHPKRVRSALDLIKCAHSDSMRAPCQQARRIAGKRQGTSIRHARMTCKYCRSSYPSKRAHCLVCQQGRATKSRHHEQHGYLAHNMACMAILDCRTGRASTIHCYVLHLLWAKVCGKS